MHLKPLSDHVEQIKSQSDVLSVAMEVQQDLRSSILVGEEQARDVVYSFLHLNAI